MICVHTYGTICATTMCKGQQCAFAKSVFNFLAFNSAQNTPAGVIKGPKIAIKCIGAKILRILNATISE